MANDDQFIETRFSGPYFAGAAVELANVGSRLKHGEGLEGLRRRVEAKDRVAAPVAEPDGVLLVHKHRVRLRPTPRQLPFLPVSGDRVVSPNLASVPLADPYHTV